MSAPARTRLTETPATPARNPFPAWQIVLWVLFVAGAFSGLDALLREPSAYRPPDATAMQALESTVRQSGQATTRAVVMAGGLVAATVASAGLAVCALLERRR